MRTVLHRKLRHSTYGTCMWRMACTMEIFCYYTTKAQFNLQFCGGNWTEKRKKRDIKGQRDSSVAAEGDSWVKWMFTLKMGPFVFHNLFSLEA